MATNQAAARDLTPREIEQLVELRIQLEEAIAAVHSAGKYRRGPAVVAVDAVVERATAFVSTTRGLTVSQQAKLDDMISKLRENLGKSWTPTVIPDVKELRRARNAAQHDGLAPDPARLVTWAGAAQNYVEGLVMAEFGVDVRRVTLSQAIEDPDWRTRFEEAETHIISSGREGVQPALRIANRLLTDAERRWRQYSKPPHRSNFRPEDKLINGVIDAVEKQLRTEEWVFATHPSEARWVQDVLRSREGTVDLDEAERVLSYTFSWITSLELAVREWPKSRSHRAQVRQRLLGGPGEVPYINELVSVRDDPGSERTRITWRLAAVPPEEDYDAWARRLSQALSDNSSNHFWHVDYNGTINCCVPVGDEERTREATIALKAALEVSLAEPPAPPDTTQQDALDGARLQVMQAEFQSELGQASVPRPPWVTGIQLVPNGSGKLRLTVTITAIARRIGNHWEQSDITALIRSQPAVEQCYWTGYNMDTLGVEPALSGDDITQVLGNVHVAIADSLVQAEREDRERDARLARVKRAAEQALEP